MKKLVLIIIFLVLISFVNSISENKDYPTQEIDKENILNNKEYLNSKEIIPVIIVLKDQPLHETSQRIKEKYKDKFENYKNEINNIDKKIKLNYTEEQILSMDYEKIKELELNQLSQTDKNKLKEINKNINSDLISLKKEILNDVDIKTKSVKEKIKNRILECNGIYLGDTNVISSVFARISGTCLKELNKDDNIMAVYLDGISTMQLDTSVCSTGASTWHSNGYKGGIWSLAIVDTGVDSTHPNLNNVNIQKVFNDAGKYDPYYDDNNNSVDDLQGHGTHCAGIVASSDSTYRGIASGLNSLINAKAGWLNSYGGGSMQDSDMMKAMDWAVSSGASVISYSFGNSYTTSDDTANTRFMDAIVDDLFTSIAVAAGNNGPASPSVSSFAIGYNTFSVANLNDNNNCNISDDIIANSSSKGPTWGSRTKPDITAPGMNITSTNAFWENQDDFIPMSGTSMATPHVAGAILLLLDYEGNALDPKIIRALLLNTANNTGSFSNKTNYGFGVMDLNHAYYHKDDVISGSIQQGTYKLYKGNLSGKNKVTLVWNRHFDYKGPSSPAIFYTLNDLDVRAYNETSNSLLSYSLTVDNVEQVNTNGNTVIKIYPHSYTRNFTYNSNEDFALATEGGYSNAIGPVLKLIQNVSVINSTNRTFLVTAQIKNEGDVNAFNVNVTLSLPFGLTNISGPISKNIGTINDSDVKFVNWTIKACNIQFYDNICTNFNSYSYQELQNGSVNSCSSIHIKGECDGDGVIGPGDKSILISIMKGEQIHCHYLNGTERFDFSNIFELDNDGVLGPGDVSDLVQIMKGTRALEMYSI